MPKSALGRNIDIIETKRYYSLSDYFQLYEWYYKSNDQVIKDIASLENQKVSRSTACEVSGGMHFVLV